MNDKKIYKKVNFNCVKNLVKIVAKIAIAAGNIATALSEIKSHKQQHQNKVQKREYWEV